MLNDQREALDRRFEEAKKKTSGFVGLAEVTEHDWQGSWDDWQEPVEQRMVQYGDHLEMRLAPFKDHFVIDSRRQDYNGAGFVGWLDDIVEYNGRQFYSTYWQWPKGEMFPVHFHSWREYHYVVFGCLNYVVDGRRRRLQEGEGILFAPGQLHGAVACEDTLMAMKIERLPEYAP